MLNYENNQPYSSHDNYVHGYSCSSARKTKEFASFDGISNHKKNDSGLTIIK